MGSEIKRTTWPIINCYEVGLMQQVVIVMLFKLQHIWIFDYPFFNFDDFFLIKDPLFVLSQLQIFFW